MNRLRPEQVVTMRKKYSTGQYTQNDLAREYQVSLNTIRNVLNGVTWQKLPGVTRKPIDMAAITQEDIDASAARVAAMLAADPPKKRIVPPNPMFNKPIDEDEQPTKETEK
jgi:hypothetical protein